MACMEGYIITLITFLHFPFSNVSSRCLHNWTKNCINYNSFDFLRYGFSMVSPWHFYQSTKSHTNCICLAFLQCSMTSVTPETPETPKTMRLYGISGNGNSRSPLSQTMNCNFAQNLLTGWHWLQFSSCVTSNKFFCCKSEIKENWKVIWQKPRESRESRSLGSLGVLGVSGVSESQTVNCTIAKF